MIKVSKEGNNLLFSAVSLDEANKIKSMSADEAMIYSHIEEAGRDGIWTKTITARTNLHANVIARCIKSLESQRHIKQVKSVKHPTRKIYILASLEPSVEMSGGPWFTDAEIDTDFIESLLHIVWRYIASLSYPQQYYQQQQNQHQNGSDTSDQERNKLENQQRSYPASYRGHPPVARIHEFIANSGITNVDLSLVDVRTLCEVLVYDGKLERLDGGYSYKATWASMEAASEGNNGGSGFGGGNRTANEYGFGEGFEDNFGMADVENWEINGYEDADVDGEMGGTGVLMDAFTETPCGQCPVMEYCSDSGLVNAADCVYFEDYLGSHTAAEPEAGSEAV